MDAVSGFDGILSGCGVAVRDTAFNIRIINILSSIFCLSTHDEYYAKYSGSSDTVPIKYALSLSPILGLLLVLRRMYYIYLSMC